MSTHARHQSGVVRTQMNPRVSVVIPTYNSGSRLRATLDSALHQTLPPEHLEIIVVDDGSSDGTPDMVRAHCGDNARVRLITQRNAGVAQARNRGLKACRGEFVAFLDHDDVWLPDKLEGQLRVFESHPKAAVVYCAWCHIDENDAPLPLARQLTRSAMWKPPSGRIYRWMARVNGIVSMSVPLVRTRAIRSVGGFDPRCAPHDDWDLWLRLSRRFDFQYLGRELVLYRHHATQQSSDITKTVPSYKRVVRKQWPYLLRTPRLMWFVLTGIFAIDAFPLYVQAKDALFAARYGQVARLLTLVALRHPLALFSAQWLYLAKRWLMRDSRPY